MTEWWESGLIYQIYPRSFQDSGGDGIGDLPGITVRLDYVARLGVDAIWISPIFPSPMADFGYDVADYCGIDPMFGTLADFDRLLEQAHARGLKVLLDFVPNHSSNQHPWFIESRSSRDNPKRDWYLWQDAASDGEPPNNWMSHFGGPAWTWDDATGQYYCHSFLKEQPDLNWRNPELKAAMFDALRFWLARGVDGFRIDVLWLMIKDDQFRDNPPNPGYREGEPDYWRVQPVYNADRPENLDLVREMRAVFDEFTHSVMIGEIYLPVDRLVRYYGTQGDGAHLPFNFQLINAQWRAEWLAQVIRDYEAILPNGGWPNWVLGNHDRPRIASRIGPEKARLAMMLLLTLRGTPTMYYGDEIGMTDGTILPDRVQDSAELNEPGKGQGRDPERTPMQWNDSLGAGFTTGAPWLPIANAGEVNVAVQQGDPASMLEFTRRMIELRRTYQTLAVGDLSDVRAEGNVLRYERLYKGARFLILLNFDDLAQWVSTPHGTVLLTTYGDRDGTPVHDWCEVRVHEGVTIKING